jgi:hypothetical protein
MPDSSSAGPARPTPGKAVPGQSASSGTNVLNQKFGPFPLWVYLAAVGVGLYAYEKHKGTTSTTPKGTKSGGTSGTAGTGAATQSAVEQTLQANVQAPTTNPQWEANAESVLVGYGYPMVQVQAALNTYLAGGVLSSLQQEIVNATIEAVGAPPSPPTTPANSSTTPSNPPTSNPTAPSGSNPPPSSGSTGGSDGYGTITIGGKQYAILGRAGQKVYQVAGGAPVYFGSGNSVAQGKAAEEQAAKDGGYAYTPIEYANLIVKSASSEQPGVF